MTAETSVALDTAVINVTDATDGGADQNAIIRGNFDGVDFTAGTNSSDNYYFVQSLKHT